VNAGGELEKRKAFTLFATLPTGAFGLEYTSAGWVTFGSQTEAGIDPEGTLAAAGITYQRLRHPIELYHGDSTYQMTSVVFSTVFDGNAFVIATFADDSTFLYYNGTLVGASWGGTVYTGWATTTAQAQDLKRLLEALGYTVTLIDPDDVSLYLDTAPLVRLTPNLDWSTAGDGYMGATLIGQDGAPTAAVAASRTFTITAGSTSSGTLTLTAPESVGGDDITIGTITTTGVKTPTECATLITAAVNDLTWATGYSAASNAAVVTVYAPVSFGAFTSNLHVTYTGDITADSSGSTTGAMKLTLTPGTVDVYDISATAKNLSDTLYTSLSGVYTGPVTFKWEFVENGDGITQTVHGLNESADATSASYSKYLTPGTAKSATAKCTATSSDGSPQTSHVEFSISLTLDTNQ